MLFPNLVCAHLAALTCFVVLDFICCLFHIWKANFFSRLILNMWRLLDYRCYCWEDTLNSSPCHFIMTVQEVSIDFIKRAVFLHLSRFPEMSCRTQIFGITGEGQLANVSVGLESWRTSSFSSQVIQTCSTALAFWVHAMARWWEMFLFTCRDLLLWVAECQEEWLHRPTSIHAEQPWNSPVQRTVQNKNEGKHVLDLLVQQRALSFSDQCLFTASTR